MHTLRVGMVGAGPAAQAIHLPTLARMPGVRVTQVMDVVPDIAAAVAEPLGARVSSSLEELLGGEPFEIAVVGSPDRFHAAQIEALVGAGVRGVLAEKPLAISLAEAERVARAVTDAGVALVVGAMHTYDPAWLAASESYDDPGPYHVRSAIYIPANSHFEDMATTMVRPEPVDRPPASPAQLVRGGILGLAIHNLPLIRHFLPAIDEVEFATFVQPWGYVITGRGPAGSVELLARTGGTWRPDWTLTVWGERDELELSFPPSYVQAGSAVATLRRPDGASTWGPCPAGGYEAEWRELLAILDGAAPRYPLPVLLDDLGYALALADLAVAALPATEGVA